MDVETQFLKDRTVIFGSLPMLMFIILLPLKFLSEHERLIFTHVSLGVGVHYVHVLSFLH